MSNVWKDEQDSFCIHHLAQEPHRGTRWPQKDKRDAKWSQTDENWLSNDVTSLKRYARSKGTTKREKTTTKGCKMVRNWSLCSNKLSLNPVKGFRTDCGWSVTCLLVKHSSGLFGCLLSFGQEIIRRSKCEQHENKSLWNVTAKTCDYAASWQPLSRSTETLLQTVREHRRADFIHFDLKNLTPAQTWRLKRSAAQPDVNETWRFRS